MRFWGDYGRSVMSLMKHLFCQFFMCVILLWTVWAAIHLPRTGIFPIHLFNHLMSMKDDDALCFILDLRVDIVIVSQFLISSSSSRPSIHQLSLQVFNSFSFFCFLICFAVFAGHYINCLCRSSMVFLKTQALDIHSFSFWFAVFAGHSIIGE